MFSTRTAQIEDVTKISNVLALSWKTVYRGIVNDDYLNTLKDSHWVDFLNTRLNGDDVFSLVLLENEEIIGTSVLGKSEKENEIHLISLYLLPEKIGQGLGHIFYNEIEKEIKTRRYPKCVLDVFENNIRAIDFYKAHGFVDTYKRATTTLGKQDYPYIIMEKHFDQNILETDVSGHERLYPLSKCS